MPVQENRTETRYVTANSAGDARDRLIEHLSGQGSKGSVFDDKDDAVNAAADARKFMHLTGDTVYVVTLGVKSC